MERNILYYPDDEDLMSTAAPTPSLLGTNGGISNMTSSSSATPGTSTTSSSQMNVCLPATLIFIDEDDGKMKTKITNYCIPSSNIFSPLGTTVNNIIVNTPLINTSSYSSSSYSSSSIKDIPKTTRVTQPIMEVALTETKETSKEVIVESKEELPSEVPKEDISKENKLDENLSKENTTRDNSLKEDSSKTDEIKLSPKREKKIKLKLEKKLKNKIKFDNNEIIPPI